jgi:MFS superfamily sulfate permease-like transporter
VTDYGVNGKLGATWPNITAGEAPRFASSSDIRTVVCDLSASSYLDLAGSHMLHELHSELAARGIALRIVGARGRVRDLLRADGRGRESRRARQGRHTRWFFG